MGVGSFNNGGWGRGSFNNGGRVFSIMGRESFNNGEEGVFQ